MANDSIVEMCPTTSGDGSGDFPKWLDYALHKEEVSKPKVDRDCFKIPFFQVHYIQVF